jgi:hypothetical protein
MGTCIAGVVMHLTSGGGKATVELTLGLLDESFQGAGEELICGCEGERVGEHLCVSVCVCVCVYVCVVCKCVCAHVCVQQLKGTRCFWLMHTKLLCCTLSPMAVLF